MSTTLIERDPLALSSFTDLFPSALHGSFPKVPRASDSRTKSLFARQLEALSREKSATELAADFGVSQVKLPSSIDLSRETGPARSQLGSFEIW